MILALDPGNRETGFVRFESGRVIEAGVSSNPLMLERLRVIGGYVSAGIVGSTMLAIEMMRARGMPMSNDAMETLVWIGRFMQAWHEPDAVKLIYRADVKLHVCGSAKARDPNIRQALIDLLGPPGTKRAPGPTYGVSSHAWAALGVAVTAQQGAA